MLGWGHGLSSGKGQHSMNLIYAPDEYLATLTAKDLVHNINTATEAAYRVLRAWPINPHIPAQAWQADCVARDKLIAGWSAIASEAALALTAPELPFWPNLGRVEE